VGERHELVLMDINGDAAVAAPPVAQILRRRASFDCRAVARVASSDQSNAQEETHVIGTIALQHWRWLAVAALLVAFPACGSNTATVPTPTPLATTSLQGVWTGVITDSVVGAGTLTFDLKPKYPGLSATVVAGSWRAVFAASGQEYTDVVEGVLLPLSISQALFTATCSFAPPFFNVPAGLSFNVLVSDRRMTGSYGSGGCSGFGTGSIDLTRQ